MHIIPRCPGPSKTNLHQRFLITAEVSPPKGTDLKEVLTDAELIRGWVDAINVTDNQKAIMRMNPLAVSRALSESRSSIHAADMQGRNRLALQSIFLGICHGYQQHLCHDR
ncbi:MAG: hypothetical protein R2741_03285 [Methanolobus sp.]